MPVLVPSLQVLLPSGQKTAKAQIRLPVGLQILET